VNKIEKFTKEKKQNPETEKTIKGFAFRFISCYTLPMLLFPEKKDYPKDFYYHRTSSPTYREYLGSCGLSTFDLQKGPQFFWRKKIFWDFFGIVKWERIDEEPDIGYIRKKTWLRHAFVVWIPYSKERKDFSFLWRKLWFTDHFEETGFAELSGHREKWSDPAKNNGNSWDTGLPRRILTETENSPRNDWACEYLSSWNDRAKRALKKFEKSWCSLKMVTPEEFVEAFRKTKVKHWHKSVYIGYYKKMVAIDPSALRQWIAYDRDGKNIGWLAVHDYLGTHSVHLVAFTDQRAYDLQPGTGLMAEWYRDSYEKDIRYLTIDHLRNTGWPRDQRWYTDFKLNFITTRLSFRDAYFTFF
jgi:hypothetical protein